MTISNQNEIKEKNYEEIIKELNNTIVIYKKKIQDLEKEKKKLSKKKVERNDQLKRENLKKPINEYTEIFTSSLSKYLSEEYTNETKENGKKRQLNDIYDDTGIKKTAFTNYTTTRLPRYTETLIMIKDYLNLPFSYLFGETLTTNIDKDKIDISMLYGLDDKSMTNLKSIKSILNSEHDEEKPNAYIKLLLINKLISDNSFLDCLVKLFSKITEKELLTDKTKDLNILTNKYDDDYISFLSYNTYENFISSINELVKTEKIPKIVIQSTKKISNNIN